MTEKLSNRIFYNINTLKTYFDIIISSQSNDSKERGNFLQFLQNNHFIRIFNPKNMKIKKSQDNNTISTIIDTIQKSQNNILQLYKNIQCLMIPYDLLFDDTGNIKDILKFMETKKKHSKRNLILNDSFLEIHIVIKNNNFYFN